MANYLKDHQPAESEAQSFRSFRSVTGGPARRHVRPDASSPRRTQGIASLMKDNYDSPDNKITGMGSKRMQADRNRSPGMHKLLNQNDSSMIKGWDRKDTVAAPWESGGVQWSFTGLGRKRIDQDRNQSPGMRTALQDTNPAYSGIDVDPRKEVGKTSQSGKRSPLRQLSPRQMHESSSATGPQLANIARSRFQNIDPKASSVGNKSKIATHASGAAIACASQKPPSEENARPQKPPSEEHTRPQPLQDCANTIEATAHKSKQAARKKPPPPLVLPP